jgi:Ni/Co efflux regulator RcnB
MKQEIGMNTGYALALIVAGLLAAGPTIAGKPASPGGSGSSEQPGQPDHARVKQQDGATGKSATPGSGRQSEQRGPPQHAQDRRQDGDQTTQRHSTLPAPTTGRRFGDQQRTLVRDYYAEDFRRGHCPPGLAKKQNGCMPPGQAKKWAVGQQLPRDVIFHNLPPRLATQIGQPPSGHRYVRVASDILLIASRTGLVFDAIPLSGTP